MAKNKSFYDSLSKNMDSYGYYLNRLTELAITMFKWENLPDTIDVRYLELTLFFRGKAVLFNDSVIGYLGLPFNSINGLDVYGLPKAYKAYGVNGYNSEQLDKTNSAICWNNYTHTPEFITMRNFAQRLWNLDRIVDVNANAQKTPVLIQCDEQQKLSLLNVYKQFDGNEPVIFGTKDLDLKSLGVLKTEAPYVADKIYMLKNQIWNEALTSLGISNINVEKKERLISDEVTRSMGGTIASRYGRLEARQECAENFNKIFGTNISVSYKEDYRTLDDDIMLNDDTADNDGSLISPDIEKGGV